MFLELINVAMWKWLHWGNRRKVVGEPPARKTLTDLSSGLLEPQGKPGWGMNTILVPKNDLRFSWAYLECPDSWGLEG